MTCKLVREDAARPRLKTQRKRAKKITARPVRTGRAVGRAAIGTRSGAFLTS